ncbi:general secretion pathway protein GspM [Acetobacter sacchari]|uniref:General secretion pathway protein GspM n=1 Tax=Acetobacter sacchari TaxID=2661687 RepID=A0ABS3LVH2_9PROT|nr:type II secretion system protein GspM [Acetobacter sacchari]MBO1359905.1 general secretion pathway protein GspM [Acetobacter sacchari]
MASPLSSSSSLPGARLPVGRAGKLTAIGLAAITLTLLWLLASVVTGLYDNLKDHAEGKRDILFRTRALVASIPRLHEEAIRAAEEGSRGGVLLGEDSDATAQARLQELVEAAGQAAQIQLSSQEPLPLVRQGLFERLAVRVSLTGSWPALVRFLDTVSSTDSPALLVEDLQIQSAGSSRLADEASHGRMIDASVTVVALRSPAAARTEAHP